jgi:hypothetical protein
MITVLLTLTALTSVAMAKTVALSNLGDQNERTTDNQAQGKDRQAQRAQQREH